MEPAEWIGLVGRVLDDSGKGEGCSVCSCKARSPADEHGNVGVHGPHRRVGGEAAFGGGIPLVHLVGCAGEHLANAATGTVADGFEGAGRSP